MAELKLVISDPKSGKSVQRDLAESNVLAGISIKQKVKGEDIGLPGYELEVTGGSDKCGFPMRSGVSGERKRILTEQSVGYSGLIRPLGKGRKHRRFNGTRKRVTVCGESLTDSIKQLNLKVLKKGKEDLFTVAKEESPKADSSKDAPKDNKKDDTKVKEAPTKVEENTNSSDKKVESLKEEPSAEDFTKEDKKSESKEEVNEKTDDSEPKKDPSADSKELSKAEDKN
jgi:small subunit ribosomal protein S6e